MTAKNDITGDKLISKTNTDKYRDNFAAIFDKNKCERCGKTLFEDALHTCTPKEEKRQQHGKYQKATTARR